MLVGPEDENQRDEDGGEESGTGGQPLENEATIETANPEELQSFIDKINAANIGEGHLLLDLINTLPKVNSILGQGHTKTRILKYLQSKALLPASLVGKSQSKITKKSDVADFEKVIITACTNQVHLASLKSGILLPFGEALASATFTAKNTGNSTINKVALLAHLLVHELATSLWESIHSPVDPANRPAYLEQTDGVAAAKEAIGNQLISVANNIKNNLDTTMCNAEHCGAEAAMQMKDIDPSAATFANAKELFTLQTTYVNLHDELLSNLDCSGSSAAEGTIERRFKCFNSFIGPYGRNKNMGLFYCFLVWEGKNTRWLTKRLPEAVARGSSSLQGQQPNSPPDASKANNKGITLTKKQQRQVEMYQQVLSSTLASPENRSSISSTNANSPPTEPESLQLLENKKRYLTEKTNAEKAAKLQRAIEGNAFGSLDQQTQEKIKRKWIQSLLSDDEEDN